MKLLHSKTEGILQNNWLVHNYNYYCNFNLLYNCLGCTNEISPAQLIGKKVFMNVSPQSGALEEIKKVLGKCGAHRTQFLNKNVDVIIVDKRQSRRKHLPQIPAKHSRATCMIKATMGKARTGSSSVEEIGKRWNIPIYDYRTILSGCQLHQKNNEKHNIKPSQVQKLKAPFIKVEDRSRRYRPVFAKMKTVPFIDFNAETPKSPFETWYNENVCASRKGDILLPRTCELCQGTYSDLDKHLMSARHTAAANEDSLFAGIDSLIARGPSLQEFEKIIEDQSKTIK